VLLVAAGLASAQAAEDPVFDVPVLSSTPLNAHTLKTSERDGVVTEEVRFHSEKDGDKDVDIFAFFSYPKGARKLPAFIWNPGGLSQASTIWTEPPARRGYAVLCIDFPQPGYRSTGGYPINAGLDLGADPHNAPIYHGAVALLKAVTYLESRPEVDKDRIGMGGSSWGGFFTTLMAGVDPRLKAATCIYGTGSLQLGNAWWDGQSRRGGKSPVVDREHWAKTLDPAWRLQHRKTPVAWFTGTNDGFYYLISVMRTYKLAGGPKHLTLLANWDHALPPVLNEQVYAWLDVHLKGKRPFLTVTPVEVVGRGGHLLTRWTFDGEGQGAELIASYGEAGHWQGRYWHTFSAEIMGHACEAVLPAGTLPCYVSGTVLDGKGFRYSTALVRVDAAALGVRAVVPVPDFDGCREWGGFEEAHLAYLVRHDRQGQRRWVPKVSRDAKEGKQSAVLPAGTTLLPPVLYAPGVRHQFRCLLKAAKPVAVTVQLEAEQKPFEVGTDWTEVRMDLTPPKDLTAGVHASVRVPPGANVLIDAVSFRPIIRAE
jgi:dienelactone hydrolase